LQPIVGQISLAIIFFIMRLHGWRRIINSRARSVIILWLVLRRHLKWSYNTKMLKKISAIIAEEYPLVGRLVRTSINGHYCSVKLLVQKAKRRYVILEFGASFKRYTMLGFTLHGTQIDIALNTFGDFITNIVGAKKQRSAIRKRRTRRNKRIRGPLCPTAQFYLGASTATNCRRSTRTLCAVIFFVLLGQLRINAI